MKKAEELPGEREGVSGVRRYPEERSEFNINCGPPDALSVVVWMEMGLACTELVVKWTGDPWNGMGAECTGLVATWIGDPWNARDAATGCTGLGT